MRRIRHVVVDPGHGGTNLGALGYRATREKVLTLEISQRIAKELRAHSNLRVTLTRTRDVGIALRERPRIANRLRADVLISVHCNAATNPKARGMEVWFLAPESAAEVIEDIVVREEGIPQRGSPQDRRWNAADLVKRLRLEQAHKDSETFAFALRAGLKQHRKGARFRHVRQAAFGVLKEARMPAVVLEVGYISHPEEELQLLRPEVHGQVARAVLEGLIRFDDHLRRRGPKGKGSSAQPGQKRSTTKARTKR